MVLRYSSSELVSEKCVETIDRGVSAVFEQSAVPGQSECHAVVSSPLGDLGTLQPAATMIATKPWRSPWKVMSSNPARKTAGRKTLRPHERNSGPPQVR